MLIPIGHEEDEVRRWPWISITILALCILVFYTARLQEERTQEVAGEKLSEVITYYYQRPYLELDDELAADADWWFDYGDEYGYEDGYEDVEDEPEQAPEVGPIQKQSEQDQLDELMAAWQEARNAIPAYRWGLVPSSFDFGDLIASMFMHAGMWHLLGNMLFFWLAGPPLEDVWGRPVFAAFYLAAGVVAGLIWVARYPSSDIPLVGASGAVAGLMGAFMVRFWSAKIRMFYFYFFFGFRTGTFSSPAWLMLGLWFASEVFWASALDEFAGQAGGVANLAHVGGFAFGAATAAAIAYLKIEEKVFRPKIDAKLGEEEDTIVEQAHELRQEGRIEEAWELLSAEVAQNPRHWEANLALWDVALQLERPEQAKAAFLRCIQHELRQGEHQLAVFHWFELTEQIPEVELDLDFRIRLGEALLIEERDEEAAELLAGAHENLDPALPVGVRVRLARTAARARSASAPAICQSLIGDPAVPEEIRNEIREALGRAQGLGLRAPRDAPAAAPAEAEPLPLSEEAPAHRTLKVMPAVPKGLTGEKISLDVAGQGARLLPLQNVQTVAAARIDAGLEPAFVVIDLLVDSLWSDRPQIRTVRLRSDEFDARALSESQSDPHRALVAFIDNVVAASGASPLPDAASIRGEPFYSFASLSEYESKVFGFVAS